ncbi:MAG: alpha/beta fold hydrolase [Elainellaceae cyanobacterium]
MPLPIDGAPFTQPDSINLIERIQTQAIATPFCERPIATAFVHWPRALAPDESAPLIAHPEAQAPLLLIHGFDSSVLEFRRLMPRLAHYRETWAIDLLGFGFTERPPSVPYTAASIKQHLYATWRSLIDRPVVLVGASMGGAAAMDFALTYPDSVEALVLLDSVGAARGPNLSRFLPPLVGQLAAGILRNPGVRQRISRQAYFDPTFASDDAARCAALHLACPNWQGALTDFTRSGGYSVLTRRQIAQVAQPTLLLWGRNDAILGTKTATELQRLIPNSVLSWIDHCGHVPHLERPDEVTERIRTYAIGQSLYRLSP